MGLLDEEAVLVLQILSGCDLSSDSSSFVMCGSVPPVT